MKHFRLKRKKTNDITLDGKAIAFCNQQPGWLRLLVAVWFSFISGVFITVFIIQWRQIDWTNRPYWYELLLGTFFFFIFPLLMWIGAICYALFAKSIDLRLDPGSGQAILNRKNLFGMQLTRYPLSKVEIASIKLQAENPAYDESKFVLRMPDGTKIEMNCFEDDEEAKAWIMRIRRVISGHAVDT